MKPCLKNISNNYIHSPSPNSRTPRQLTNSSTRFMSLGRCGYTMRKILHTSSATACPTAPPMATATSTAGGRSFMGARSFFLTPYAGLFCARYGSVRWVDASPLLRGKTSGEPRCAWTLQSSRQQLHLMPAYHRAQTSYSTE